MEPNLSAFDLNAVLRHALHGCGLDDDVLPHLEAAVAQALPAGGDDAFLAGLLATIGRTQQELGCTVEEALHTIAANLGRFYVNVAWDGGPLPEGLSDSSYVLAAGKLVRLGALPEAERVRFAQAPVPPAPTLVPRGGGCAGILFMAIAASAAVAL